MGAHGFLGVQVRHWGSRVRIVLGLPSSSLLGPEKSQLVSGEATVARSWMDWSQILSTPCVCGPDVAGVDGTPASAVVRTGRWTLASC